MPQSLPLPLFFPPLQPVVRAAPEARFCRKTAPAALWAAVHLPALPLEALGERADAARPVAVIDHDAPRAPLIALSAGACAAGLRPGMSAGVASARVAGLDLQVRDPVREAAALDQLAAWGQNFTSLVSPEPPVTLLLEIGGSLKLFGGMKALREKLQAGLAAQGYAATLAFAPTPRAALWLARAGVNEPVVDKHGIAGELGALPLAALQLPERTARDFERLGVRTLRDAFRLPRDGLARRFHPALLRDWDRALGQLPEARRHWRPEQDFAAERELPIALRETGHLEPFIEDLLTELARTLRRHDAGIDRLTLTFEHSRQPPTQIELRLLAVSRDFAHLERLTRTRLERFRLPAAVTSIRLRSGCFKPIVSGTAALLEAQPEPAAERTALIETLRARLGRDAVCGLMAVPDPRPENASQRTEPGAATPVPGKQPSRPVWLLETPLALTEAKGALRHQHQRLQLMAGPERIEAGWWSGNTVDRDYYIARTPAGARLWIYREHRTRRWFLHGYFA
ncbi:MAG TPA: DNA polymerase Y family protein [Gammaproteobacteria bacterium]|nr:DNA polymerase Y family protein [Gammaproteobacteria bacterium]